MRIISAVFIVMLFLLMGCSGSPVPLVEKTTSALFIDISGHIYFSGLENPPAFVEVKVWNKNLLNWEASFWAYPDPDGYTISNYKLTRSGDNLSFTAIEPVGWDYYSPATLHRDNVDGDLDGLDWTFIEE